VFYFCPVVIGGNTTPDYQKNVIKKIHIALQNENFANRSRTSPEAFVRERVLTFKVLIVFIMNLLTKAIQRELDLFYQAVTDSDQPLHKVSKSAFTQARRKLKHTAFIELSDLVVEDFYKEAPHQKYWKNQRVVACDGGHMVLPGSKEIEAELGHTVVKKKGVWLIWPASLRCMMY
jgi:hypothetical protein